jgi:hypothetical protein
MITTPKQTSTVQNMEWNGGYDLTKEIYEAV